MYCIIKKREKKLFKDTFYQTDSIGVRHTKTIRQPTNYLSVYDHFVGLVFKGCSKFSLIKHTWKLTSFLNYVSGVSSCPTHLTCLRAYLLYVFMFLAYLRVFLPLFLTCLAWVDYFTCLTFFYFLSASYFWCTLCVFTIFYKTWNSPEQTATSRNNKNKQFVFQSLHIFNFKLVLRKQSPCDILKIVFRIPWARCLKNTFEFIIW